MLSFFSNASIWMRNTHTKPPQLKKVSSLGQEGQGAVRTPKETASLLRDMLLKEHKASDTESTLQVKCKGQDINVAALLARNDLKWVDTHQKALSILPGGSQADIKTVLSKFRYESEPNMFSTHLSEMIETKGQ